MSKRYSNQKLRMLRNQIPISRLISDFLRIPAKSRGIFRFLCPLCSEFQTATNPKTNLARCFRCQKTSILSTWSWPSNPATSASR